MVITNISLSIITTGLSTARLTEQIIHPIMPSSFYAYKPRSSPDISTSPHLQFAKFNHEISKPKTFTMEANGEAAEKE